MKGRADKHHAQRHRLSVYEGVPLVMTRVVHRRLLDPVDKYKNVNLDVLIPRTFVGSTTNVRPTFAQ